jgi:DNA-binding beta-propeller fold protein YncE
MTRMPVGKWSLFVATALVAALAGRARAQPALEPVKTIELKGKPGGLDHCALDSRRDRLFVANKANNTMDVVDLKEGKLLKQVRNQTGVQGIAYAPDLDRLFVALGAGGYCNVFDGENYKLVNTVKFADDADNVHYDPRSQRAYVAHAEKALGVIDGKTFKQVTDIELPGGAENFQIDPTRPMMFLCVPSPSELLVIDLEKNEVAHRYPLKMSGANFTLALDEANKRILVGCRKEPKVIVMDSESGKEISSVDIPKDIDDLFLDAKRKRAYALCGEGFIAVLRQVDADHYEVQEKIPTAAGAKTGMFDADSGRLFLVVPREEGKAAPEIRVYQAKP